MSDYNRFHSYRREILEATIRQVTGPREPRDMSILDIGPSDWTVQSPVFRSFGRTAVLGLDISDDRTHGGHLSSVALGSLPEERYVTDLNEADSVECADAFDIVTFTEVLEHLNRPAKPVLELLKTTVAKGGTLILQTPNFARVANRIKLLCGVNPQEHLRDSRHNPGHIREYTARELIEAASKAGFAVISFAAANYLTSQKLKRVAKEVALPKKLKDGFTITLRNE